MFLGVTGFISGFRLGGKCIAANFKGGGRGRECNLNPRGQPPYVTGFGKILRKGSACDSCNARF